MRGVTGEPGRPKTMHATLSRLSAGEGATRRKAVSASFLRINTNWRPLTEAKAVPTTEITKLACSNAPRLGTPLLTCYRRCEALARSYILATIGGTRDGRVVTVAVVRLVTFS